MELLKIHIIGTEIFISAVLTTKRKIILQKSSTVFDKILEKHGTALITCLVDLQTGELISIQQQVEISIQQPHKKSIIGNIKSKFSAGWDEMPSVILKYLPAIAVQSLCYIFNLSLSQGKFISFLSVQKLSHFTREATLSLSLITDQ